MILINSKATQIQYRPHILGYSIAGKLGYSLKILLTAQYNQEKVVAIIRESITAWKTSPQTPLLSDLRTRRLPFSSIVMVLITLTPGTMVYETTENFFLRKIHR
jgi:hypothetical protein